MSRWTFALVTGCALLVSVGSKAQEPVCAEAAAQIRDCSASFCPIIDRSADCAAGLNELAEGLSGADCDVERAELVRATSCAGLASQRGVARRAGNVCERATEHMMACLEQYCASAEADDPICLAMQGMDEHELPECTPEAQSGARALLEMSCEQIFGF